MDKEAIRQQVWQALADRGVARFPLPPRGRVPNFVGAEAAARAIAATGVWGGAKVLKCNPDAPQRPLRAAALREGKLVYMAVPRLRDLRCFVELDPRKIDHPSKASTIKGASEVGRPVHPDKMESVDLVVAGSVATDRRGGRVGKGGGFSDLEFALGRSLGLVGPRTPVVTTVHDLQVLPGPLPMTDHDVPVDLIGTPHGVIETKTLHPKPRGIEWDLLTEEQVASMPILGELRRRGL